ncbi:MAG: ABC transporter substrate-binding protein [Chitinophagaceae bacterium]|nr:ABC transporter substrate-binding protein [Chitinophagaceae bacterium]
MKTGFLLPRSTVYPAIGYDFLDGCKSFLQHAGLPANIITDNIGFGLDEKEVYSKNEAMLLSHNADVVVAFVDGRCADMLQPLYTATGKILLLVNMGAHYPDILSSPSPVIEHSFNTAFNSWLTGQLAADEKNSSSIMATSYYDGGYLNVYAMVSKYQQRGGIINYNYISHFKQEDFSTATLQEYLKTNPEEKSMLCLFSGDVSHLMYKAMMELQQQRELKLYVSPMMLDETLQDVLGDDFTIKNVKGHTSWVSSLDNENNRLFKKRFTEYGGKKPGIFSLLGWETGIILEQIQKLFAEGIKGTALTEKLKSIQFDSPRGWLKIDRQTQQTYSPAYLVSVAGNFDLVIEACLENSEDERQKFYTEKPEGAASGWRNTYLCS